MDICDIHPSVIDCVLKQSGLNRDEPTPRLLPTQPALELIRLLADTKQWEPFYEGLKQQSRMAPELGLDRDNIREAQAYLILRLGMLIGLRAAQETMDMHETARYLVAARG